MSPSSPFLVVKRPGDEAIAWVTCQMDRAGLQALRTFDLQVARPDPAECPCPQHGAEQCNCQMIVLLVYRNDSQPISMVAHSSDGWTWFSIIDTPQQRADPQLEVAIRHALAVESQQVTGSASRPILSSE